MLSVNMFDPHPPFDPPEEILAKVDPESVPMPEFADGDLETQERLAGLDFQGNGAQSPAGYDARGMVAAYYAQIELIDMQLARLIDALESTDQLRNTVIVYMSDHGEMLGDHGLIYKGCRFYEGLVRVPLIVSWPDGLAQGQVIDSLVELTDVAPTLREIAGLEQCGFAEGRSLVPSLT
jgi:arylsulfatase A-like enzyme